jgi:hypothetical protein
MLTRRQRNEIFQTLDEKGIDLDDCDLDTQNPTVTHVPTGSRFSITVFEGFNTNWHVKDGPSSDFGETAARNWEDVLERLRCWAGEVQYVNDVPDFWRELRRTPAILAAAENGEIGNAAFTADEQAQISVQIREIASYIRTTRELTTDQMEQVEERLADLDEASGRVGRKDWVLMLEGAALNLFITDLIPAHTVQHILVTALTGLGHLFGIGGVPPSLPPA